MHLLEVKAIKVLYGKAIALNGLTLSIDEKEMVGVVGPNGAGKSTLLRAISALVPSEGEILFHGDRIDHHPSHEIVRKGIIHCPERRQLFVDFTVAENLEMGYFLRKDKGKIQEDLAYVTRADEAYPIGNDIINSQDGKFLAMTATMTETLLRFVPENNQLFAATLLCGSCQHCSIFHEGRTDHGVVGI